MSLDTLINISLAVLCGGAVGFERQWNQGMAGLRTNALVAFGSACFVTIGAHTGDDRVAAQIVSGMGFLGAGVILHEGPTVRGLNTAATLWCAAAAGSLAASGMRWEAAYAALGVIVLNLGLRHVQAAINCHVPHPTDVEAAYAMEIACGGAGVDEIYETLSRGIANAGLEIREMRREAIGLDDAAPGGVRLSAEVSAHSRLDSAVSALVEEISNRPGVVSARWTVAVAHAAPSATALVRR